MRIYYRISNNSYNKEKIADKRSCLSNALYIFDDCEEFNLIMDNVNDPDTIDFIAACCKRFPNIKTQTTSLGNAQSFKFVLINIVESQLKDDEIVYLLEDDYFHLENAPMLINEGLQRANYVSLYDHPDKYQDADKGGDNPFISQGGEVTRVILTPSSHWKITNSTTMTFATTVGQLRRDAPVWIKHTSQGNHPNDFQAFLELGSMQRSLITPIPAASTHTEKKYLAPLIKW